jgi:hypothetical protein
MATGAAVVVCDVRGVAGMVSSANFDRLRRLNFGVRSLMQPLNADVLQREMGRYSPDDAKRVWDLVRRVATNDSLHEDYLALYGEVIDEHRAAPRTQWLDESRAAAAFLQDYSRDESERQQRANLVVRASHHVLKTPLIGPALARAARWLIRTR